MNDHRRINFRRRHWIPCALADLFAGLVFVAFVLMLCYSILGG